jgi:hypothetical protein
MRILVRPALRNAAALPQEQAITETILAAMAVRIPTPPKLTRTGTMKIPLAIPRAPPNALVATEMAKSQALNPRSILADDDVVPSPCPGDAARSC